MAVQPALEKLLARLREDAGLDEWGEVLAETATGLAVKLDSGALDAPAPVAKEFRSIVAELRPEADDDDDDWLDDGTCPTCGRGGPA